MKCRPKYLVILVPVLLCAVLLLLYCGKIREKEPMQEIAAATEAARQEFLCTKGLQGVPVSWKDAVIPEEFTGIYAEYAALQEMQLLPLRKYAGEEAVVYTYVLSEEGMYAELLTVNGILAGAHCYKPGEGKILNLQGDPVLT